MSNTLLASLQRHSQLGLLAGVESLTVSALTEQLRQKTGLGAWGLARPAAWVLHVSHKTRAVTEVALAQMSSSMQKLQSLVLKKKGSSGGSSISNSGGVSGGGGTKAGSASLHENFADVHHRM